MEETHIKEISRFKELNKETDLITIKNEGGNRNNYRNYSFIKQKRNSKKDITFKLPNIQIRKKTAESYAKLLTPSHSLERKPPDNYHITVSMIQL